MGEGKNNTQNFAFRFVYMCEIWERDKNDRKEYLDLEVHLWVEYTKSPMNCCSFA